MTNENTPHYIIELKADLDKKFENVDRQFESLDKKIKKEIDELGLMIYKTVALKEDLANFATREDFENLATKDDIREVWENMATKNDVKEIMSLVGTYEVRARKIEEILIEDYKPRIIDLEKVVYSD